MDWNQIEHMVLENEIQGIKIIHRGKDCALEAKFKTIDMTIIKNNLEFACFINENRITYSPKIPENRLVSLFVKLKKYNNSLQRLYTLFNNMKSTPREEIFT